jgi:hypothetical protein
MNEHIKKLFDRALDQAVPETWTQLSHEQITKLSEVFAELLIQQCMACSTWVGKNNTNSVEPVHTAHAINQRIKQHFGVEE